MESVIVKPLESVLSADKIVASSWIAKSSLMSDEDAVDDVGPLFEDWDCDGCPPPFFDLPPPPRLPSSYSANFCDGESVQSPYETCDNNPLIIDSRVAVQNDLINILIIVILSAIVVAFIMLVACVIWRKRLTLFNSLPLRIKPHHQDHHHDHHDGRHGHSSLDGNEMADSTSRSKVHVKKAMMMGFPTSMNHLFRGGQSSSPSGDGSIDVTNSFELTEQNIGRHVYTNPNYPTMEIGGLPFYLMPAGPTSNSPDDKVVVTDNPLAYMGTNKNQHHHQQTNFISDPESQSMGPIYEDIDYGLSPPPPPAPGDPLQSANYYNLYNNLTSSPSGLQRRLSPNNSGSTGKGGTSSSEVSFDSNITSAGSHQQPQHPLSPPTQPIRPGTSPRLLRGNQMSPSKRSVASSSGSIYYYSDTLRPSRHNRGFVIDSDSGISHSQDTPPPRVPNHQQQIAPSSTRLSRRKIETCLGSPSSSSSRSRKDKNKKGVSVRV